MNGHDLTHQLRAIHARHQAAHQRRVLAAAVVVALVCALAGLGAGSLCAWLGLSWPATAVVVVLWAVFTLRALSRTIG